MEEMIEARVTPDQVWEVWEKGIEQGQKGKIRYKILEMKKGESFSLLWKTLFVRLIFSHTVKPIPRGSEIRYKVQIKGLFAWPIRWMLGPKIKKNLGYVLKAVVRELENKRSK